MCSPKCKFFEKNLTNKQFIVLFGQTIQSGEYSSL